MPPIANIIANSGIEHDRILRHHTDAGPDTGLSHLAQVLPINAHNTALRIIKTEQQPRNCRLARPARPDNGNTSALRNSESHALQDFPIPIGKMHVIKINGAAHDIKFGCVFPVRNGHRRIKQPEHAFHVYQRLTQFTIYPAKEIEGHVKLQQIGIHRDEITDCQHSLLDMKSGHAHHHHQSDGDDRALADIHHRKRCA